MRLHLEFLLEEASAEAFLALFLPRVIKPGVTFACRVHQGKPDLLNKLTDRLRAYRDWMPDHYRIVVLADRDDDACKSLKATLERAAKNAGLSTKTAPDRAGRFVVLNRIAIEELEAWFLGDAAALRREFPGVKDFTGVVKYRNPDAVPGGAWEGLENLLKKAGHYRGGMPKTEVASRMATQLDAKDNRSESFRVFLAGLRALGAV